MRRKSNGHRQTPVLSLPSPLIIYMPAPLMRLRWVVCQEARRRARRPEVAGRGCGRGFDGGETAASTALGLLAPRPLVPAGVGSAMKERDADRGECAMCAYGVCEGRASPPWPSLLVVVLFL